jgi:chromosome segregation ATPase
VNEARKSLKEKYALECEKKELELAIGTYKTRVTALENEVSELRGEGALGLKEQLAFKETEIESIQAALEKAVTKKNVAKMTQKSLNNTLKENMSELALHKKKATELETALTKSTQDCKRLQ